MKDLSRPITTMPPAQRERVIDRAVEALSRGELVVLPTETLYGVFAAARTEPLDKLHELTKDEKDESTEPGGFTLHLPELDVIRDELALPTPVARRLVDKLLPGPARVMLEQPETNIAAITEKLGLPDGFFINNTAAVRVPDHPITRLILRKAGVPAVARRLGAASWSTGTDLGTTIESIPDSPEPAIGCVVDDGATLHQTGSTTIEIRFDGRFSVVSSGPITEEQVLSMLERRIIFVCTGNTCRSPMGEVIARKIIEQSGPTGITTIVESAGIAADDGHGASPDAVEVMRERGIDLSGHRSRMLMPAMIDRAEVVYTMTHMHAQRAMSIAPDAVHKVFPLSERAVVHDPIGQSIEVYRQTADQLESMITQRLKEITP